MPGVCRAGGNLKGTQMSMFNEWARVLVAEDNAVSRQAAIEVLSAAGLSVDVAVNGQDACNMASSGHYDLILMDVGMPVMDGLQATRAIRALPECSHTPILAVTAYGDAGRRGECEAAGMDDFISKPVQIDELYARVLKWLAAGAHASAEA
jgi:two-component system sensor histidine kinase/response regulator